MCIVIDAFRGIESAYLIAPSFATFESAESPKLTRQRTLVESAVQVVQFKYLVLHLLESIGENEMHLSEFFN